MINYNPKAWCTFIFHIHKSDTFRKLWPLMLSAGFFNDLPMDDICNNIEKHAGEILN